MTSWLSFAPAVAESFSFAKSSGQSMAIAMATATASSQAASNNRQAAAAAFAATAVSCVEQGVVETFAKSQVNPALCHRLLHAVTIYAHSLRQARRLHLLVEQCTVLPYWNCMTYGGFRRKKGWWS
jgi:hypothetical protein